MAGAKFTKSHLKSLVKECLIEILYESGSPDSHRSSSARMSEGSRPSRPPQRRNNERPVRSHPALDTVSWTSRSQEKVENPNFSSKIKNITREMTSDPVMSDIFADTARTTLQEQVNAERAGPNGTSLPTAAAGDNAARIVDASTPDQLFGESAGKWAALAFGGDGK